jgi:hypothetical protein
MEFFTTALGIGIVTVLVAGLAFWFFSSPSRASEERREEMQSRHLAHQPWDSADGRANR